MTSNDTLVHQDAGLAEAVAEAAAEDPVTAAGAEDAVTAEAEAARYAKALVNILSDVQEDQEKRSDDTRAILNILDDLDTEKSRLESTQKALMNMLDDLEVERRKVDRKNNELQEVNEAMRSFIGTAAHDLRSPLASMVGFSTLLTNNWTTLSEEQRLKFITTIDRQTHKLTGLVDDLLTLSSIEGGALSTQPELIVVAEAITGCLSANSDDTSGVLVSCAEDLHVRVDPLHLGRMLENYLQNAFRYGEPPIQIEATALGEMVEIRVVDHGTGVPAEFEPQLFHKFARADLPSTRDKKGTGLGLSIVRGLAEANGGSASYQPSVPHGSCFIVQLPTNEGPHR